ncbi:MAG: alpha-(1-_3)-arabinofuranosyltransferase family protein [Pedococcus sp.]
MPSVVRRVRTAAALLLLWAVAFAQVPREIVADTKIDLALDPWGLMARSLHLWDDTTSFGVLQNQAYGYLFPMGPFAALGQLVSPAWVTQRLWWAVLLTVGYLATRRLLVALEVGNPLTQQLAALAFALSPRVVSTLGPISSEAAPALLAPAILLPLVLASRGEWGARRAGSWSALAVLCCGGVNATATFFAVVPAALWLVTRRHWWRAPVTWWWAGATVGATAWWALPLVVLGRYSPPFLDWIESSDAVTRNVSLLDDLRGTSHWLGHLVTSAGPWWNAGYDLVAQPALVVATTVAAAAGLAGLAMRGLPHRTFLVLTALVGLLVLALPHAGSLGSPLSGAVQDLLDGPLAPLRNVHKADPVLRLPLAVGLAHLLARCMVGMRSGIRGGVRPGSGAVAAVVADAGAGAHARASSAGASRWRGVPLRGATVVVVALAALAPALPALSGQLASRGSFEEVPDAWTAAGRWLNANSADGVSLVVPASNFDEYTWGRPLDEVLRSQTSSATAVRDAVPLTPANTIRLLDSVEMRLQTGADLGGAVTVLRSAGVRFLVLRNDLDVAATGGVSPTVARASIQRTPALSLAKGFGDVEVDRFGDRVQPVEIYRIADPAPTDAVELTPLSEVMDVSGASDSLADLADAGLPDRPVVFDGDSSDAVRPDGQRVVTDGFRARDRGFGSVRGRDVSRTLTPAEAARARDYLPWPDPALRTTASYDGLAALTATTSLADDPTADGYDPADRAFSALDGLSTTAWVALSDDQPAIDLTFGTPRSVEGLEVSSLADRDRFGDFLGIPTRLKVTTDSGATTLDVAATGRAQRLARLPSEPTTHLRIQVVATDRGSQAYVTGLSEVRVPGLIVLETLTVPGGSDRPVDAYVLTEQLRGNNGCIEVRLAFRCLGDQRGPEEPAGLDRTIGVVGDASYTVTGSLAAVPGPGLDAVLDQGADAQVTASTRLSRAPQSRPAAVLDDDPATAWSPVPTDTTPTLAVQFAAPVRIADLRLVTRGEWLTGRDVTAQVSVDGRVQLADVGQDGSFTVSPTTGRNLRVRLLLGATRTDSERNTTPASGLEVSELVVDGYTPLPAAERISAPCGRGPSLLVDGSTVPTRVDGPRSAAFGVGALTVAACEPVELHAGNGRVVAEPWGGFVPARVLLTRTGTGSATPPGPSRSSTVGERSPGRLAFAVGAGEASLLSLPQNANAGWRATLGDRRLEPIVVDGWKQGFVVPAGAGGQVTVSFGPDRPYRWGLLVGGALVLLVAAAALLPSRRRARAQRAARVHPIMGLLAAVVAGPLLAGWWGLGVAVGAVALAALSGHSRWAPVLVGGLLTAAGVVQAVVAPGRLGSAGLEGSVRLLSLAAVVLLLALTWSARGPRPAGAAPGTAHWPRRSRP